MSQDEFGFYKEGRGHGFPFGFDGFLSLLLKPKDYYQILEVGSDASDETIRSNFIRLALKWHPDKRKDEAGATSRFQQINEAYQVLSDPVKRQEYDAQGIRNIQGSSLNNYLNRNKGMILSCHGLGTGFSMW
ncbi:chaperone protein DnaJ-like [Dioscorea cayenensis subsp. rotundata]|uniref:Chaperone protein DnaJ-like n=1 Tax=Dioscorea cayennensis subsp. rotundata TaxID=55577 RepID=A0AB40AJD5_DIOCR|nr:chaperone protein DnaJ-like [Dioscorea cayenensis subsp. rotundata]XP_039146233.1 chaperone protein DnaJ-like [Dioscorea cayenensis subsp. rotundata]